MAKRSSGSSAITPETKGASTSKQGRHLGNPWKAPRPRAVGENDVYSRQEEVAFSSNRPRMTQDQISAAQRRMNGTLAAAPQDVDLDTIGESDFGTPHFDQEKANAAADVADINLQGYIPTSDVERYIQEGIQRGIIDFISKRGNQVQQTQPMAPVPTAPPVVAPTTPELIANYVSHSDVDRLWDWIRQSPESGARFFGKVPESTHQLHSMIFSLQEFEKSGAVVFRSIHLTHPMGNAGSGPDEHLGFVMLAPIMSGDKLAVIHLYLSPQRRGQLVQMSAPILDLTMKHLPGFKFAVVPTDEAQARLYAQVLKPLGFAQHIVFVR